jgi:endo-1,4-beta-xylanase
MSKLRTIWVILVLISIYLLGNNGIADDNDLTRAIEENRMGLLKIRGPAGSSITVEQVEHEFWFGTAISARMFEGRATEDDQQMYFTLLKNNFNSAVHENALKWYSTERKEGNITYARADTTLMWCEKNGLRMRGHCVYWAVDKYVQEWIKQLDDRSLRARLEQRAADLLGRYRGRITEYDVNNEMLHGHYYEKRLGHTIRQDMFNWCQKTDPDAILYVNDYSILTGDKLDAYEAQIAGFIEAKVPVGGIGLQGHFGPNGVDGAKVREVLERVGRFNLPIKITEFDINTKDEDIKAKGLIDLYTTAFAHPLVYGILMWGFWEGSHWRPDAALWKRDGTPTKAAEAYRDLVYNKWWTRYNGRINQDGLCEVKLFFGHHKITIDETRSKIVWIGKDEGIKTIDMTAE